MKVLVTGGAGFIGSAVCRLLIGEGVLVVNLDRLTYAAAPGALAAVEGSAGYRLEQFDIADRDAVRRVLRQERPDAILHLAAETHVDRSIDGPHAFVQTNVVGTAVLLEETLAYWRALKGDAREAFRFVHVSTDEVYGSLGPDGAFAEDTPYAPRSPYAASKAAADHLALAWFHTYGLPVVVSNCSNNYGPFQFPEKLIPLTIINGIEGRELPVYGDGRQVRDWLHVDDHARALLRVLQCGRQGEKYNVGARCERRNIDLVQGVCAALDEMEPTDRPRRELIRHVEDRPGHDRRYAIDPAKIERELGWAPEVSFEAGLRDTVRWYLEHRDWWTPLKARYSGERLGLRVAP